MFVLKRPRRAMRRPRTQSLKWLMFPDQAAAIHRIVRTVGLSTRSSRWTGPTAESGRTDLHRQQSAGAAREWPGSTLAITQDSDRYPPHKSGRPTRQPATDEAGCGSIESKRIPELVIVMS
jgi:hypothetical protein